MQLPDRRILEVPAPTSDMSGVGRFLPEDPPAPQAPAGEEEHQSANGGDPDDGSDPDPSSDSSGDPDPEDFDQEVPPPYTETLTSESECGEGPETLREMLHFMGNTVPPLYVVTKLVDPQHATLYRAQVHVRHDVGHGGGRYTYTLHEASAFHTTYRLAISDATRRALWSLRSRYCEELDNTDYRGIPQRVPGTENTTVKMAAAGEPGEVRLDLMARVTSWLNTDLEDTTNEMLGWMEKYHAVCRKLVLAEAQLAGVAPPVPPPPSSPRRSPPRKRARFGFSGPSTRVVG